MIAAYRHEDRRHGRELMVKLIDSITSGVPKALVEIITLGRTLKKRAADVLAYFDRPGTSNGPTEAINGRHRCAASDSTCRAGRPGSRGVRESRAARDVDSDPGRRRPGVRRGRDP